MTDKRNFDFWPLWVLGVTALLLPLTPSVIGIDWLSAWTGLEGVIIMFFLALGWHFLIGVHPQLRLDTSVVLGSVGMALLLMGQAFLLSPVGFTPLLWQWVFFLLILPALISVLKLYHTKAGFLLLAVLTLHAQWAVMQFAWQRDLGFPLLGESYLRSEVPGVAKFFVLDHKVVRAYGPYSHPNSLASALVIGLTLLAFLSVTSRKGTQQARVGARWIWLLAGWMGLALTLSFSRSGLAGVSILGLVYVLGDRRWRRLRWEPRATFLLALLLVFAPLFAWRMVDSEGVALKERVQGVSYALNLFPDQMIWGTGVGSYPWRLKEWATTRGVALEAWQMTYVHMVPLLLVIELGLFMGGGLLLLGGYWLKKNRIFPYLLLPLLPAFFLDHFLYTYPMMWFLVCCVAVLTLNRSCHGR